MKLNYLPEIVKVRQDYNHWVATETLEDYALRFAPKSFRKWPSWLVANTAIGGISFLALEAIGGSLMMSYGFANTFWAIVFVGIIIFLVSFPISYYAAKYSIDMDLLTRGAGFGYIGSTITSLIYASFTFIFFALEATIMAQALVLYWHWYLSLAYPALFMRELRKSLKALCHQEYGDLTPITVCNFYLLLTIDYLGFAEKVTQKFMLLLTKIFLTNQ